MHPRCANAHNCLVPALGDDDQSVVLWMKISDSALPLPAVVDLKLSGL